jgi:hypothetical protein
MTDVLIAVAIPTRNRAEYAINAIHSLRGQPAPLHVFVSDNSADEEQVRQLADFCRSLGDPLVTYMRAPGNLPQGAHWDWAARQALARSSATHVTIHYDRKITRPGQASVWADVAHRFSNKVFTYVTDAVASQPPPRRLWQPPWTGRLYRVQTARTVAATARGEAAEIGHALPVLSNCIVPRSVVETIVRRFGTLCDSTTADSCFAYRFCALHDDYLHADRALTVLYGSHRSAALGYLSGEGGDFADYRKTWLGDVWHDAAPIPGLNLGYNMLFHEYELVRREVGDERLPPLERDGYLRDLARGLAWIRDPEARVRATELLKDFGWEGDFPELLFVEPSASVARRAYRVMRQRFTLFLADRLGVAPANITGLVFASDEEGLRYALRYPRQPVSDAAHLAIVDAAEISASLD